MDKILLWIIYIHKRGLWRFFLKKLQNYFFLYWPTWVYTSSLCVCHQIMFIYISTQKYKCNFRNYDETLTHPFSTRLLIMTMMQMFCSHIILQKSSMLGLTGPWAATYNCGFLKPWETQSADMIFGKSECHRCMCKTGNLFCWLCCVHVLLHCNVKNNTGIKKIVHWSFCSECLNTTLIAVSSIVAPFLYESGFIIYLFSGLFEEFQSGFRITEEKQHY